MYHLINNTSHKIEKIFHQELPKFTADGPGWVCVCASRCLESKDASWNTATPPVFRARYLPATLCIHDSFSWEFSGSQTIISTFTGVVYRTIKCLFMSCNNVTQAFIHQDTGTRAKIHVLKSIAHGESEGDRAAWCTSLLI